MNGTMICGQKRKIDSRLNYLSQQRFFIHEIKIKS